MKAIKLLTIIIFIVLLTAISIDGSVFHYAWYQQQFAKYDLYQKLSPELVADQTQNLFDYLQENKSLNHSYYTEREINHLKDVKALVELLKTSLFISLAGLIGGLLYIYQKEGKASLIKTITKAAVATLIFYAGFSFLIIFNFEIIFLLFHQLSFNNDFWLLDPTTENLINIFPPELFFSLSQVVITKIIIAAVISLVLTQYWLKKPS